MTIRQLILLIKLDNNRMSVLLVDCPGNAFIMVDQKISIFTNRAYNWCQSYLFDRYYCGWQHFGLCKTWSTTRIYFGSIVLIIFIMFIMIRLFILQSRQICMLMIRKKATEINDFYSQENFCVFYTNETINTTYELKLPIEKVCFHSQNIDYILLQNSTGLIMTAFVPN